MSKMSELHSDLEAIRRVMEDEPDPVGQAIRAAFAALDDLIVLANQHHTRDQVCAESRALGQMLNRCQLLASFANTVNAPLKVVSRG